MTELSRQDSGTAAELVQTQFATPSANLVTIATARRIARTGRGRDAAGRNRVPAVALAEILDPEIRIALAGSSAQLDRHIATDGRRSGKGAAVRVVGVASLGGIGGRSGRGFLVQVEAVAGAAGFGRVAGAGEGAVGDGGFDASGVEGVAAVAFAAVFDAESGIVFAGGGAFLDGEAVVEVITAAQGALVRGFGVASCVAVASYGGARAGV